MNDQPELRVGDVEREQIAQLLNQAVGEGRLTLTEYNERVGLAYAARTRGELDLVVADLPVARPSAAPLPAVYEGGTGKRQWAVAVMSGAVRNGRWRVEADISAFAMMGGIELDFRKAVLTSKVTTITAVAIMGGIQITVPPGVRVEVGGFSFMGGKDVNVDEDSVTPDSPTIRINGYAVMGGIEIVTKQPKQSKRIGSYDD
ncbi:DUF1707 SHOCT-like domain-containing protein [Allokutzneria albata]|uniref:Cell wall-active antibiotics response 4TMS YvqF n=1 Tax=Allokutzneria albata TaxID=211114 RepID=A0A1H0CFM9_ALLAB|nr:DUF1707 domain-containing protein [Allokutzneria albata]SDN56708.1 Cell wall-active antibiotics response 4TMS YvqF [Allokutzneria albata]